MGYSKKFDVYVADEKEQVHENCGIFAMYVKEPRNLFLDLKYGGIGVQQRGQNAAGMVMMNDDFKDTIHKADGLIKNVFNEEISLKFQDPNRWGILHCRYGTNGNYCLENNQPCCVTMSDGTLITIAHNGEFVGIKKYKNNPEMSDTRIFANILARTKGLNWDEKIIKALKKIEGSYGLVVGIKDTLYMARDKYGIRPLLVGSINDGWVIASETQSFENIQAKLLREIKPGEISKVNSSKGFEVIKEGNYKNKNECIFEFPYTRSPNSLYLTPNGEWSSIYEFRLKSGVYLAQQFKEKYKDIDFVIGIPDSGLAIAEGFHNELNIPVKNIITKKPSQYFPNLPTRTFMNDKERSGILNAVFQKLSFVPNPKIYEGKRIVCLDDSVVRSSTSKIIVQKLKELGAKSVDWVSGLPMVTNVCYLGISIRSQEELVAFLNKGDEKKIAKAIGARSLTFISSENIIKAANNGEFIKPELQLEIFKCNGFCGGCLNHSKGNVYPVGRDGVPYKRK
ncbi:MAG: hypothetical protein WCG91_01305 [Candidatus Shapirobacteria bacterium]